MGLFSLFSKKQKNQDAEVEETTAEVEQDANVHEMFSYPEEPQESYESRGEEYGPWDMNDENVPDFDAYLDFGAIYLPYMQDL
ncbi:MAG: DUF3710 domain-containing protein, partial [Bifidobacteriaceae bacterium]|nr:DUF3710 domain-containing protein [Bifidobacteriaceae bacterium]